jgi:hypothetical protein
LKKKKEKERERERNVQREFVTCVTRILSKAALEDLKKKKEKEREREREREMRKENLSLV